MFAGTCRYVYERRYQLNKLHDEQLQKNGGDQRGIWEAGLSSRSSENNRGAGKNTGREDQEAFTGDRGGIRFKRRSLENDIRGAGGFQGEKSSESVARPGRLKEVRFRPVSDTADEAGSKMPEEWLCKLN